MLNAPALLADFTWNSPRSAYATYDDMETARRAVAMLQGREVRLVCVCEAHACPPVLLTLLQLDGHVIAVHVKEEQAGPKRAATEEPLLEAPPAKKHMSEPDYSDAPELSTFESVGSSSVSDDEDGEDDDAEENDE